ncbi:hypothetical protein [Xylophilus sp. Leaf220]|uniref:hypothetical protein n=1 Tax=Xylophilus sp. Leaf220 TaxID=1735686 RepID=UPI0006FD932A|nr:hypothetical protein [Xylophilus sp. Leaf220]KQM79839.1 hypothetical protein ASE76_01135 [Xylophilus sp. Leaf220]
MSALPASFASLPAARPVALDFARDTITFELPPGLRVSQQLYAIASAEALAAALQQAGLPEHGATVLGAPLATPPAVKFTTYNGFRVLTVDGGNGMCVHVQCDRFKNPAHWYGSESRTDQSGRAWERQIGTLVIDNFGDLVPAEGGAA